MQLSTTLLFKEMSYKIQRLMWTILKLKHFWRVIPVNPLELQMFQNLGLEQLETVRALSGQGASVQLHFHRIVHHNTVVKEDVIQGSKTDSEIETLLAPTGDCSLQGHSKSQALAEPLVQDLPWTDGEEQGAGGVHGLQTIVPITFEDQKLKTEDFEDFEEAIRSENKTTNTRDSGDKSSDIFNNSEVSDKKEVPEIFTNDNSTSEDKDTTYSTITDMKPPATADKSDTLQEEYINEQIYGFAILSKDKSSFTKFVRTLENSGITLPNSLVFVAPNITSTSGKHSNREFQSRSHEEDRQKITDQESDQSNTDEASNSLCETVAYDDRKINDMFKDMKLQTQISDTRVTNDNVIHNVQTDETYIPKEIDKKSKINQTRNVKNNNIILNRIRNITERSIVECDYKETMVQVKELVEKLINRQLDELEELEFRSCHLEKEHLKEFLLDEILKAVVCKISKLSITFTENVTDLIPSYCQIASNYKSTNLNLAFNDLKNEDIEALDENLAKNDKYTELDISYNRNIEPDGYENVGKIVTEHEVKTLRLAGCDISVDDLHKLSDGMGDAKNDKLMELDINHNRNIESAGYEYIGKIIQKHEVRTLRLADCDISDDDLLKLFDGMGDAKLEVLDISCTNNLTTEGFGYIGKQVANKGIKRLKLSDTQLNVETLTAFYNEVVGSIKDSESQQVLVEEIDVSYNSTMEPEAYKVLGSMVKLFGVKKLSLAGCGLRKEHLADFREKMKETGQYTKMKSLNAGDNTSIRKGIVEIAKIVKECLLEELDISECRFSVNELEEFIEALGKAKLKCLCLGEKRQFDQNYISQVCNLLPPIEETLRLKGTVRDHPRSMLQDNLDILESKLEIKLDDDVTLRAQIKHEVTKFSIIEQAI